LGVHSGFTYEQSELMRKKEQRRGGTTFLRVFLNQRAFFYDTAAGGRIFFLKGDIMLIKLFTIPVGDSGGALQEMNAFLRLLNGWTSIRNAAPITWSFDATLCSIIRPLFFFK